MIQKYATRPQFCKDCGAMFRQHVAKHFQRVRCPRCHDNKKYKHLRADAGQENKP